ncbi:reductive dehalogenase domain-containing protein [Hydrogenophaga sp. IBVHS1]|jgi:ferredoxin|uniref:reductive dehalogenase domain-containing protein n=2 Tax=unclassified Hydrogenophaga TaxID=2610897 RepID=UPI000A2D400D|nr:reductive dehalogenase domain-containing protein [Hydrogenophaga sp. IBVHS1]OSZ74529.1 Fe-S protein [Hydrogenophaga sp. IBVHS1]
MPRLFSNRDRHFDLGVLPTELLPRAAVEPAAGVRQPDDAMPPGADSVLGALPEYRALFQAHLDGPVAPARAPVPDDLETRARNLKASAYFLECTLAGVCEIHPQDWLQPTSSPHSHAFVFLVEFSREPKPGEPGAEWIVGTHAERTDLRCAEVAAVMAGYIRALGWSARGHVAGHTDLDLAALAQRAGVAKAVDGVLAMPFSKRGFRVGVVTSDYAVAVDQPIAPDASLAWPDSDTYMGALGTRPGFEDDELARRPVHMGRYEMERIRRVDEPTTLLLRDEIRRVPKRADLFTRALAGDLGEKARIERTRFAVKHPLAFAMTPLIRALVPLQGTREPLQPTGLGGDLSDPQRNADAIKALAHVLGADLVGICKAEPWMYYSHDEVEGRPIGPYHRYAVVMLMDQGFETMEGASGDDWISGAQSMRAYLRGATMAGVMAAHVRRMGYSARAHSNAHSELLHLPAVLMAGLGELSRIGELILNPFIGPRSKSVLITTDLPLVVDKPIDFGLQAMCNLCMKCARECPCNAIPFGPKVMFNGYEIWKPDVEKCGKYRLTNMKGSACGRCMKTCPYNREDLVESERLLWLSIEVPSSRRQLIEHDDATGGGQRNAVKRWWFDLEIVDGIAVKPPGGVNERDLDPSRTDKLARAQKLAFFPPELQPPGGTTLQTVAPLDRAAGLGAYAAAESPLAARRRRGRGVPEK